MKRWMWLAALLCVTGCGGGASQKSADPGGPPGPKEASARERARIHTELGVSYYEAARPAIALEELNESIRIDRNYAPAWGARALVYMELGEDAKAEADFKQAMRVDPNDSDTKNNYGLFLCQRDRGQQGIRYFLEAIKNPLYQTPDVAYKNAGLCARKMGDLKAAEDYFQRALRANPNQPQALYSMADLSFARGDFIAGKQHLDRYMRAVPTPGPEALWLGARLERKLGDRTAMLSYGNQLRLRFPSAPETKAFMEGRFQ